MSRPEDTLPPDLYYNDTTSRQYTTSSRIQHIQSQMTYRALSILNLDTPSFVLDIGCGSGLSGEILSSDPHAPSDSSSDNDADDTSDYSINNDPSLRTSQNPGGPHTWVGLDISASMLSIARLERDVEGDLMLSDMGQGLPFRPGSFDGAISISALQWLCQAETSHEADAPALRLRRFFGDLYKVLRRGARAVLQFYAKDAKQRDMICSAAIKAGFGAGVLEDDGGTKNEKTYLVCTVGGGDVRNTVGGMEGVDVEERAGAGTKRARKGTEREGSRRWIMQRKEKLERKGKVVKNSSKYTGRRRRVAF